MPVMIPVQSIKVERNGGPVIPTPGEPFNFTDDEIAELELSAPDALSAPDIRAAEKLLEAMKDAQGGSEKPARRGRKAADANLDDL